MSFRGYRRPDGRLGIRNRILVMFTVICAEEVSRRIAYAVPDTVVVGWRDCQAKEYATRKLVRLGTHPNVGGVLVVSLGCECSNAGEIAEAIEVQGTPAALLTIQEAGGTRASIQRGIELVTALQRRADEAPCVKIQPADLIVGVECGGSDATSGLAANPAVGVAADIHVAAGGAVLFEETNELWGCERALVERAANPAVAGEIISAIGVSREWSDRTNQVAISPGNMAGGLTTIEEKSLGAMCKAGTTIIRGVLHGGTWDDPPGKGLYLLAPFYVEEQGFTGAGTISDPNGVTELIACGAHVVVFTTGRGSVTGSGIAPVIKVTGNPDTYRRMIDNMDVNAGLVITGERSLDAVGRDIYDEVLAVAAGKLTKAEELGHFEFHI